MSSSIGSLLSSLGNRPDLKEDRPSPPREVKRHAPEEEDDEQEEHEESSSKKSKNDEEPERDTLDFFSADAPDYDEDDPEWIIEEKKLLVEEYGKIISMSFDENDRVFFTCEVCNVQCSEKRMLSAHCLGMKHMKKKALLDRKLQGKDTPNTDKSMRKKYNKPQWQGKYGDREEGDNNKWRRNRRPNRMYDNFGGNRNFPPPHPYGPPGFFPQSGPPPNFSGPWGPQPPNAYNAHPPAAYEGNGNTKSSLTGGDTGSLLQKLANCAVQNEKDSELAINVVIALMKSLKDFNHKRGETRFIEVLTEADLTFKTLKTLKPMNSSSDSSSLQDNSQNPSSSSIYDGMADFAQSISSGNSKTQDSSADQYYASQNNPANNSYSSNSGPPFPTSYPPVGVPPPTSNANDANGYSQNAQGNPYDYSGQDYSSYYNYGPPGPWGYYGQGTNASYSQSSDAQNMQTTTNTTSSQAAGKSPDKSNKGANVLGSLAPPPPPPPPLPADGSAPDLSNYGYAAGYSMGFYNMHPPGQNQPY
ncbi:hypothetical protein SK128_024822 [Halocaridina rubra]|uniref:C2H2-type domain-containing protein n=1 Tax=Halocaridina rubra TaxID=373956 RepID=A0AAN9ADY3_HALRR